MIKKLATRGMAAVLVLTSMFFCACGKTESTSQKEENLNNETGVYEFTDLGISMPKESEYTNVKFDKYGIYCLKTTKSEGHTNYSFARLKNDDTKLEEVFLSSGNVKLDYLVTGNDGYFYAIRTIYPDKKALQNIADEKAYVGNGEKKLVKYASSGDEVWAVPLSDGDENSYILGDVYLSGKGVLTFSQDGGYTLYSEDNGRASIPPLKVDGNFHGDREFFTSSDGRVFVGETDSKWRYCISEIDVKKLTLKDKYYTPEDIKNGGIFFAGITNDFYYIDNNSVYGFNLGDTASNKICSFEDAGFYADNMLIFYEYDKEIYRIITDYNVSSGRTFDMRKKGYQSEEKKVITIGTAFTDEYVKKRIVDFNQNNDKYIIKIKDYAEDGYSTNNSIYKALNKDIEEGNAPDIMVLNSYASIDSYISKGLLEPLDSYIEDDEEIKKKRYLKNINSLLSRNGKQYMIMPFFSVATCAASESLLDGVEVTLSNYLNLCNKHNIKLQNVMGDLTFNSAEDLYTTSGFDFIDFENNTCNFKNYRFIDLLIFTRELRRAQNNNSKNIDENCFRNKKALLKSCYISSFEDYRIIKDGYFSADVVFNGYPGDERGVSYIDPGMIFAISSLSENKEAAWEFIRYFLLDEYQYKIDWGFPVNEDAFNALMEKSQQDKYYVDDNGKKVITNGKVIIGDREITITPLNKSEAESFKAFICSIDRLRHQDSEIIGIISEAAKPYYNGEITAEKATSLIQHRVEKYLSSK